MWKPKTRVYMLLYRLFLLGVRCLQIKMSEFHSIKLCNQKRKQQHTQVSVAQRADLICNEKRFRH